MYVCYLEATHAFNQSLDQKPEMLKVKVLNDSETVQYTLFIINSYIIS